VAGRNHAARKICKENAFPGWTDPENTMDGKNTDEAGTTLHSLFTTLFPIDGFGVTTVVPDGIGRIHLMSGCLAFS